MLVQSLKLELRSLRGFGIFEEVIWGACLMGLDNQRLTLRFGDFVGIGAGRPHAKGDSLSRVEALVDLLKMARVKGGLCFRFQGQGFEGSVETDCL